MYILKRFLLTGSLVLCFVSAAAAQPAWQGFYAGGSVGGALNRSTANTMSSFSPTGYFAASSVNALTIAGRQRLNDDAFTGGLEAGFNAQSGSAVFGVETDYAALRMNATQSNTVTYPCCIGSSFTITQALKTRWLYTLRPRFGITSGPALFYVTGGFALTRLNYQEAFSDNFGPASGSAEFSKTRAGWIAGGGMAFQLRQEHWSVKAEYLYSDPGRTTADSNNLTAFVPPLSFPDNIFTHSVALHSHILRGGIDYRW